MLMGGDFCGNSEIDFFHSMARYILKTKNFGKVCEGSNKVVDQKLSQLWTIKKGSVAFTINKIIQCYAGNVEGFKMSDVVGMSIPFRDADGMVLNHSLNVLSYINSGVCNIKVDPHSSTVS